MEMVTVPVLTGRNRGELFRGSAAARPEPAYFYGTYDKEVLNGGAPTPR